MADTLQCSIWRRAQHPGRLTHSFHGGGKHSRGYTSLGKKIGTRKASRSDRAYVEEHEVLQYLRKKIAHYLHDYRIHWFRSFGLPPSNGQHKQLTSSMIKMLMRRLQQREGHQGGGRGSERGEIQVFSRLDIGHSDYLGQQFVNSEALHLNQT